MIKATKIIALIIVAAAIVWATQKQNQPDVSTVNRAVDWADEPVERASVSHTNSNFRCGGKTHCSQMSSCEEATFYLQNCPGTKMDGDEDGIPCESQHCAD